ncbi:hypothetical protein E8D34_01625 [Nocardioides sp. GY 10113]|uniref:hypothetical protein n=1 Tax=Nocardioides sp. GY 10113 TaxID=2569761 RepID=UPI0010A78DBC|nr:hypothetical protein [Nocardioides sp. GY 10113]TIC89217.1 hypothetical protein E8D34_01625 [Nocardioides sp. GY 10113]
MRAVVLPSGLPGVNEFSHAGWWAGRAGARVAAVQVDGGTRVTGEALRGADPDDGERVLLVAAPVVDWLPAGGLAERMVSLHAWRDGVLALAESHPAASTVLFCWPDPPREAAQVVAMAIGERPLLDVGAAVEHSADDPVLEDLLPGSSTGGPAGPAGAGGSGALGAFAAGLAAARTTGRPPTWITAAAAAGDAADVLARGLASADAPAEELADAPALRAESRRVQNALIDAGIRLHGRRDLLLWPVPPVAGRVPLDLAVECAAEVLRGQVERPAAVPGDGAVEDHPRGWAR